MLIDICCCAMVSNTSYSLGLKSRSYFMVAELIVHTIIAVEENLTFSKFKVSKRGLLVRFKIVKQD